MGNNTRTFNKDFRDAKASRSLKKPKDIDYTSKMGYQDGSPFSNRPYIDIHTPSGMIDMSNTGIPLMANNMYLPPYSGMWNMGTPHVREIPMAQNGLNTPEEWEKEIRSVEHRIGDPSKWTQANYQELQDKLNEYKAWRENTPEGRAVIDYHNEPNEYVVPLPTHLKKAYGGDPSLPNIEGHYPFGGQYTKTHTHFKTGGWLDDMPKAQGTEPTSIVQQEKVIPYNKRFIYRPEDIANAGLQERAAGCHKGECLEGANTYYNKYVAPGFNMPDTWKTNEAYGIISGNENMPYGTSADSWDLAALLQAKGAAQNYAAPLYDENKVRNYEREAEINWNKLSPEEKKKIYSGMSLGTLVNYGDYGSGSEYRRSGSNEKAGLYPSRHSARVVGFTEDGTPVVYDYGKIKKLDESGLGHPITNITTPKEYSKYNYDYVKNWQDKNTGYEYNPNEKLFLLGKNIRANESSIEDDELKFVEGINKNIKRFMEITGSPQEDIIKAGKVAFGIMQGETRGGRGSAKAKMKEIAKMYLPGTGEASKGYTRMKKEMLAGDETNRYSQYLQNLGYDPKDMDLWDPETAAVATTALILSRKGDVDGVDKWYLRAQQHKQPSFGDKKLDYLKRGDSDYATNVINNTSRLFSPKTGYGISETQKWLSEKQKAIAENKEKLENIKREEYAKQIREKNLDSLNKLKGSASADYFPTVESLPSESTSTGIKNKYMIRQKKYGGWLDDMPKAQKGLNQTQQDSVRHLAGQMMDFERRKGGYDPNIGQAYGLTNYGYNQSQLPYNQVPYNWKEPRTREEAVNLYMKEVANNPRLSGFKTAMEKGEAGDFLYNTGRDPRVYLMDQYLKSIGQTAGLPNRATYNVDTKTPKWTPELQKNLDAAWNQYSPEIYKLKENDRRILLNKGRDFYYQNIDKVNGEPNPAYEATWKPRIWESVNTYKKHGGWLNDYDLPKAQGTEPTSQVKERSEKETLEGISNDPKFKLKKPQDVKPSDVVFDVNPFTGQAQQRDYVNLDEISVSPKGPKIDPSLIPAQARAAMESYNKGPRPEIKPSAEEQGYTSRAFDALTHPFAAFQEAMGPKSNSADRFSSDWLRNQQLEKGRNLMDLAVYGAAAAPALEAAGAYAAPQITSALNAPFTYGSTTLPWLTANNAMVASGLAKSLSETGNPNSELYSSLGEAFKNPNNQTIPKALLNTLGTGLGFVGPQYKAAQSAFLDDATRAGQIISEGAQNLGQRINQFRQDPNSLASRLGRIQFQPRQLQPLEPIPTALFSSDATWEQFRNRINQMNADARNSLRQTNQLPPPPAEITIPSSLTNQQSAVNTATASAPSRTANQSGLVPLHPDDLSGVNDLSDFANIVTDWERINNIDVQNTMDPDEVLERLNRFTGVNLTDRNAPNYIRNLNPEEKRAALRRAASELHTMFTPEEISSMKLTRPVSNKSRFSREELMSNAPEELKNQLTQMSDEDFVNTVFTPEGKLVPYSESRKLAGENVSFDPNTGKVIIKNKKELAKEDYIKRFNENIEKLNEMIGRRNKSGFNYRVKGLRSGPGNSSLLTFETPEGQGLPGGEQSWYVNLQPGQFEGDVENIANLEYLRGIPGIEMTNTTGSVFSDYRPRKGTGTYQALNDYLKELGLGRLKPGFNSQTDYSKAAWENFLKSGRGYGYYNDPHTVYGIMKKKGGALKKSTTSKNIKSSINKLMARNETMFGPKGKAYFDPDTKPYYKTGGWLDDVK